MASSSSGQDQGRRQAHAAADEQDPNSCPTGSAICVPPGEIDPPLQGSDSPAHAAQRSGETSRTCGMMLTRAVFSEACDAQKLGVPERGVTSPLLPLLTPVAPSPPTSPAMSLAILSAV